MINKERFTVTAHEQNCVCECVYIEIVTKMRGLNVTWLPVLAAAEHSVVPIIAQVSVVHSRGAGAIE